MGMSVTLRFSSLSTEPTSCGRFIHSTCTRVPPEASASKRTT